MSLKKLVTIATSGFIPEIKVTGPVKTPTYVKIDAVKTLVLNGRRVYEHNPSNPSEKVLLQPSTYAKVNFGSKDAAPVESAQDEPKNGPIPEQVAPTEDPTSAVEPEVPVTDTNEDQKTADETVDTTAQDEPKNDPIPEQVTPAEDPAPVVEPEAPVTDGASNEASDSKTEEAAPAPQPQNNNNQQKSKKDKKNKR